MFNLSVTASSCRLPYRGEALAWQKAQSLRQRLPSVGELSNEVGLRGCFYSGLLFFAIYFSSRSAFSASCCRRSFLMRFFSLSTRGQGHEKPSFSLHQRVSG